MDGVEIQRGKGGCFLKGLEGGLSVDVDVDVVS